jgi:hypothetical protein
MSDLNNKCGIYITLQPHGYEVDWIDHKSFLEAFMKDQGFVVQSECRSYSKNVDTDALTEKIIELIRNPAQP